MSKDRNKLVHIHSSQLNRQPKPEALVPGELAVNNFSGGSAFEGAFISTKNSADKVVRFSEDRIIANWIENKEVIPYEAYVRGSNSATTDVTADDLANNTSNIVIKLNQVVARNTEYDEKVNGAKDIYGHEINPISADGYKDGAGLAIDMSRYAMIDANPSFSSVTTTCGAELQGKTSVKGSACGSELDVNVNTIKENATTIDTTACTHNYNNTNDFKVVECAAGSGDTLIHSSHSFEVVSNDIKLEQPIGGSGKTLIRSCDEVRIESKNIILTDGECGSGQTTLETNDLCIAGDKKINVYGDETNLGLDCEDNTIASNNRVFGDGILITNSINDISKYPSSKNIDIKSYGNICEDALSSATICGLEETNIGINCDETMVSTLTTVKGGKTVIDANNNIELSAKQNIVESADGEISINANSGICIESGDELRLFGLNNTHIGINCDGSKSNEIIYERVSNTTSPCGIKAETVDDALEEVMERDRVHHTEETSSDGTIVHTVWQDSGDCENRFTFEIRNTKVKMSAETYPASSEYLKKYVLWQEVGTTREDIGEIDIPKDHVLKDARIVNGKVNDDTFTPCNGDADCQWYIELTWNVFDPTSGHTADKTIYVPANSLVQDNSYDNTSAIKFETFYDGEKTHVSADTTIKVHTSNNVEQSAVKSNGEHTLSSYTLTIHQGGDTNVFDPFAEDAEITMNHSALTINYGREGGVESAVTYDTAEAATIYIPTEVSDLGRGSLTIQHNNGSGETYDPSSDSTILLNHSALTINYGREGDVERTVTYDTAEAATVYIPTEVSDLGRGNLTIQHNNGSGETYDPGSDSTILLNHSALTINYGVNVSGRTSSTTYDTSASSVIDVPTHISDMGRGTLKWQYGANVCDLDTETLGEYDPGDSGATINIPSSIENITNNIMSLNGNICESASCLTIDTDICVTDGHTVKADGFYATSDERMKENIEAINASDYEKASLVELKSFNFKNDGAKTKTYGVIAQTLKSVGLENIVHNDDEGNLSVDYISFLILRIAKLESELKTMEGKLNELLNNEK